MKIAFVAQTVSLLLPQANSLRHIFIYIFIQRLVNGQPLMKIAFVAQTVSLLLPQADSLRHIFIYIFIQRLVNGQPLMLNSFDCKHDDDHRNNQHHRRNPVNGQHERVIQFAHTH